MKYRVSKLIGIQPPTDGFNEMEEQLAKVLAENTIQTLYAKLPTNRMKAIVALHFELGYPQELVADMFGVGQDQIAQDVRMVRKVMLGHKYQKHRGTGYNQKPKTISLPDLFRVILAFQHA